jgi:hypothetical protein
MSDAPAISDPAPVRRYAVWANLEHVQGMLLRGKDVPSDLVVVSSAIAELDGGLPDSVRRRVLEMIVETSADLSSDVHGETPDGTPIWRPKGTAGPTQLETMIVQMIKNASDELAEAQRVKSSHRIQAARAVEATLWNVLRTLVRPTAAPPAAAAESTTTEEQPS